MASAFSTDPTRAVLLKFALRCQNGAPVTTPTRPETEVPRSHSHLTSCRICAGQELPVILSLGETPLANSLLKAGQLDQPEPRYALELAMCPTCSLVQIKETVAPELLFRNYLYFTSFSETMLRHAQELSREVVTAKKLGAESLVVEIASNDGYLLQYYKALNVPVIGIEPAKNVAEVSVGKGIETITEFFNAELASSLVSAGKKADVIHANNVLAHVADLHGVVSGISVLLKEDGVAIIEVPYLKDMIDGTEFDTIYHEHLCYYSLSSLAVLFRQHNLYVNDVKRIPLHGGSLQLFIGKNDNPSQSVKDLMASEIDWGMRELNFYKDFATQIETLKAQLTELLDKLKTEGKSIAAYGASAKGSTLLNSFNIGKQYLDFIVDRSSAKQGYYSPGTHLPILSPEVLLERQPDYLLLLTWNFADEIMQQQELYRSRGGKFIVPIPRLIVV
ncbi:MAG: class I SAM-dependent methyltransferase [Cyanobacteria bacterium SZAS LIN-5]|nr:class I SAM-dependent methyltransferase [Cyanobacteria bacterium SZAS LIN-5]